MAHGTFIVIEGGDGAGKDTQIDLLKERYKDLGVVFTREPGGTPVGKELRRMLLSGEHEVAPQAEALMFLADRAQHMAELILPSLEKGRHIISNRSWISLMAYQVYGRELEHLRSVIEMVHREIYKERTQDWIVYLDIDPAAGLARTTRRKKGNVLDQAPFAFHQRVQRGFEEVLAKEENVLRIDAMRSVEDIHAEIAARLDPIVGFNTA